MEVEPEFTMHAAKQVLARHIDPADVLAVARNAIRLGLSGRIRGRGLKVVMEGCSIITVMHDGLMEWRGTRAERRKGGTARA